MGYLHIDFYCVEYKQNPVVRLDSEMNFVCDLHVDLYCVGYTKNLCVWRRGVREGGGQMVAGRR